MIQRHEELQVFPLMSVMMRRPAGVFDPLMHVMGLTALTVQLPRLLLVRCSPSLAVDSSDFGHVLLELNAGCVFVPADRGCVVVVLLA